jgi:hypothetical protein
MLWHYTTAAALYCIIEDGEITPRVEGAYFDPFFKRVLRLPHNPAIKPCLWFTADGHVESDAWGKASMFGRQVLTHYPDSGTARIGVDLRTAPNGWDQIKGCCTANTPERLRQLEDAGRLGLAEDPRDWFGSFDPVPARKWLAVERWVSGWCGGVWQRTE